MNIYPNNRTDRPPEPETKSRLYDTEALNLSGCLLCMPRQKARLFPGKQTEASRKDIQNHQVLTFERGQRTANLEEQQKNLS